MFSLMSCVGTVEDVDPEVTKTAEIPSSVISFYGIANAVAVGSDAVEVYFTPISGANADKIVYELRYDGLLDPITIPAALLPTPDYKGEVHYLIQNLDYTRTYTFSVQAKDLENNISSSSFVTASAQPFQTTTARFKGIQSLTNTTGPAGKYSLNVGWILADHSGAFSGMEEDGDPLYYEVTLLESEKLSPSDFDNKAYGIADGRIQYFFTTDNFFVTVPGLQPGTEYHVMVRAHNKLYVDNSSNPYFKHEENHRYQTLATYSDQAANTDIIEDSVILSTPDGNDGKNSLDIAWDIIVGTIDHIRIYYFKSETSFVASTEITENCVIGVNTIKCQKLDYNYLNYIIRDLQTGSDYSTVVAACIGYNCEEYKLFDKKTRKVQANLANYAGVKSIKGPQSITNINSITLELLPPDLSTGTLDGILIRYYKNTPDNIFTLNHPFEDSNGTELLVSEVTDPLNTYSIEINHVDPSSQDEYCFSAIPYLYDSAESIVFDETNEFFICMVPNPLGTPEERMIQTPLSTQFGGVNSSTYDPSTKAVISLWNAPTSGIFDQYIFVWREKTSSSEPFSYIEALKQDQTEYQLSYLAPNLSQNAIYLSNEQLPAAGLSKEYEMGILTQYIFYTNYYTPLPNTLEGYSEATEVRDLIITMPSE